MSIVFTLCIDRTNMARRGRLGTAGHWSSSRWHAAQTKEMSLPLCH
jgi:hypothetical protein